MREKTLYVTDMDGTLLNNGSFVSPLSAEIITDLSADGAMITVATARTPATVVPLMEGAETNIPYIVMTGAATFDRSAMAYGDVRPIAAADMARAKDLFARFGVNPFIYHLSGNFINVYHSPGLNAAESEFYGIRRDLTLKHFTFEPLSAELEAAPTVLFFGMGPSESVEPLADALRADGAYDISCYPDIYLRGTSIIEVFARGVSKASAVTGLAERLGADRIVVFGDNYNDLPMMEVADLAVAVGNAFGAVKGAADIVIGPNFDDSVARFIEEDFYNC